ncbi:MAG: spore coat protein U domain-containing protein [Deltaproteobacteria bacterium]|nr:spore coat protein U domain-containing protein [Deltaproteobacteria bacterium]
MALLLGTPARAAPTNLSVQATVLSKSQCRFRTNMGPPLLDFGDLDPLSGVDVIATTSVQFRCQGSAPIAVFAISRDDGLHPGGPNLPRMQHDTDGTQYLPYELDLDPTSGVVPKMVWQTLSITGTVRGPDYTTAMAGPYTDLVVLSILP